MSIKTITNISTLMKYASALGKARLSGDEQRIVNAKRDHDSYKKLCLESDEIIFQIPQTSIKH